MSISSFPKEQNSQGRVKLGIGYFSGFFLNFHFLFVCLFVCVFFFPFFNVEVHNPSAESICSVHAFDICRESLDLEPTYVRIVGHTLLDTASTVCPQVSMHFKQVEQVNYSYCSEFTLQTRALLQIADHVKSENE